MTFPACDGTKRKFVCALCGRPPGERCPRARPPAPPGPKRCPACDGTGFWPKDSDQDCLVCKGTGKWDHQPKGVA